MSQPLNLSKPHRPVHVGVILMAGETEIMDVGPVDIFSTMSKHFIDSLPDWFLPPTVRKQAIDCKFHWVTEAGPGVEARLTGAIRLNPTDSFETCPPLDIVLIGAHRFPYVPNEAELAFVRKAYDESTAFLTICGGVDVPRLAGLLEGKTATGPRMMLDMLRQQSPGTTWVPKRWVRDGKLWTSGALLNGLDMVHNFVKETWGDEEDSLSGFALRCGAYPNRDVDYKDVPWSL